ncbi:transcription factor bHLH118-like [Nicotiana tabacum]|uniref:Transcription factor bHLH118-like n=1 Tax=Nicotiana tabacum TaxID=4097 RepID=A0A1S4DE25_TOBAC|nr:PREDICTED: transcription factor bHLH118-like [Nicotiana tabacum]
MDNYLWEIFSSKQNTEQDHDHHHQLLQIPNFQLNGFCQQDQIPNQDLIGGPREISSVNSNNNYASVPTTMSSVNRSNLDNSNKGLIRRPESTISSTDDSKKVVHRNVERHRRQEMANLLTSLRSLLPLEFIKGKRSASDHMQIAVNYIRHLRKNIEELDNRRKQIKNSLDNLGAENGSSSTCYVHNNSVAVNTCQDGMEILINVNSHKEEMFSLSKVLRWLLQQGLNVVSCVNSKQDEWTLIRIQCQVSDISGVSTVGLQKKLTDLIS